jgi:hypothetical protein
MNTYTIDEFGIKFAGIQTLDGRCQGTDITVSPKVQVSYHGYDDFVPKGVLPDGVGWTQGEVELVGDEIVLAKEDNSTDILVLLLCPATGGKTIYSTDEACLVVLHDGEVIETNRTKRTNKGGKLYD